MLGIPKEDLVNSADEAASFVTKRISENVDYIKIVADMPGPDQATLDALVAAAHKHSKLVIAHAVAAETYAMAQDAKVDIITHSPRNRVLDSKSCARMVAENRVVVPTLVMMRAVTGRPALSSLLPLLARPSTVLAIVKAKMRSGPQTYENARDSVAAMYKAGVPILAGTDAHTEPGSPFSVKHGTSLHEELELLVEAGLSNIDALRAATCLPAKYFGLGDRGVIEVGKRADLVLLAGNPIEDIRATSSIQRVWCAGIEVKRHLS
jgi:imidazolonepropionase-like amidohydrolase